MKREMEARADSQNIGLGVLGKLYPNLKTGMSAFVLVFGTAMLILSLFLIYDYYEAIRYYQINQVGFLSSRLYVQTSFSLLIVLGSLLFLGVKRLGWIMLTGAFISLLINVLFLFGGRTVYTLLSVQKGLHDDINPDILALEVLLISLVVGLIALMCLRVVRETFAVKSGSLWATIVVALIIVLVQHYIPELF